MQVDEPRPPTPPTRYRPSGLPDRRRRPPKRVRDNLPEPPPPVALQIPAAEPDPLPPQLEPGVNTEPTQPRTREYITTKCGVHGEYKVYPNRPTHDPDKSVELLDLCDAPELAPAQPAPLQEQRPWYYPFKNASVALHTMWRNLDPNPNSDDGQNNLVHGVILDPEYNVEDMKKYDAKRANTCLDDFDATPVGEPPNGWRTATVKLKLPCPKNRTLEGDAPEVEIPGLFYRSLL